MLNVEPSVDVKWGEEGGGEHAVSGALGTQCWCAFDSLLSKYACTFKRSCERIGIGPAWVRRAKYPLLLLLPHRTHCELPEL